MTQVPENTLDVTEGCSVDLCLKPDFYPLRSYRSFENYDRTLTDPVSSLLSTIGAAGMPVRAVVSLTPATLRNQRLSLATKRLLEKEFSWIWFQQIYEQLVTHRFRIVHWLAWLVSSLAPTTQVIDASAKLDRHLFDARCRIAVGGSQGAKHKSLGAAARVAASLGQLTSNQSRFVAERGTFLLSSEDLATLWHPPTVDVRVSKMSRATFREVEPPVGFSSREGTRRQTTLGRVKYREQRSTFGLSVDDRRRHLFVVGKTGMGKSTLIANMVASDVRAGHGILLADPHGDLADGLLDLIPKSRTNDVIVFDAGDTAYPVAFNPLHVPPGMASHRIADSVFSSISKVFGLDGASAPRLLHILRNTLLTLVDNPDTSLISIQRMLVDSVYRKSLVGRSTNPAVRDFWHNEFSKWNERDRTQYIASLQNKLGAFLTNPVLQNILGQTKSTIDIRTIMDAGQVLLVNLSKGKIGEDASNLLGSLLVSSLQSSAMSRADVPEHKRRDFFAYVDEFQNFTNESFASILSEARKYRLSLTLATQYFSRIDEVVMDSVIGNVGSMLSFQVGADDAEFIEKQFASSVTAADLMNLPKYHAYARVLVDGVPQPPFSMTTLEPEKVRQKRAGILRKWARQNYACRQEKVEKQVRGAYR